MPRKALYQVQQILQKQVLKAKVFYLIKWKGYPLESCTWQPRCNLRSAKHFIKQFERKQQLQAQSTQAFNKLRKTRSSMPKTPIINTETTLSQKPRQQPQQVVNVPSIPSLPVKIFDCQVRNGQLWYQMVLGEYKLMAQQPFLQRFYQKEVNEFKSREFSRRVLEKHNSRQPETHYIAPELLDSQVLTVFNRW